MHRYTEGKFKKEIIALLFKVSEGLYTQHMEERFL